MTDKRSTLVLFRPKGFRLRGFVSDLPWTLIIIIIIIIIVMAGEPLTGA